MGDDLYNRGRGNFLSFLARTTQKQREIEHLLDNFGDYAPDVFTALRQGKQARFLDAGSGTGRVFIPFVSKLRDDLPYKSRDIIDYTVQEPNLGMAVLFYLNYLVEDLSEQRLILDPKDRFGYEKEEFEFILSSHVLYYISDWEEAINQIYSSLVPGGTACIFMSSEQGNLFQLRNEFFPRIHGTSPRSAEQLIKVIEKMDLPYQAYTLDSVLNISPKLSEEVRHLREDGILSPSPESMLSFLLRTDFEKLPQEMQARVISFLEQRSDEKYLGLRDKAIWLKKPGEPRQRAEASCIPSKKITLECFLDRFRDQLESNFGQDLSFLSPGIKEAYFSILSFDAVLSHPISRLAFCYEENIRVSQDDMPVTFPVPGRRINDFVIVDPDPKKSRFKDLPCFRDEYYILLYTLNSDMTQYFFDHVKQEYGFLSEEVKNEIPKDEFVWLMFNLFDRFRHNQIFSSRHDGSTLVGLLLDSEYFARDRMTTPETLTPRLEEYYQHLGITPSVPCSKAV